MIKLLGIIKEALFSIVVCMVVAVVIFNKIFGKRYCQYKNNLYKIILNGEDTLIKLLSFIDAKFYPEEEQEEMFTILSKPALLSRLKLLEPEEVENIKILKGNYKTIKALYK